MQVPLFDIVAHMVRWVSYFFQMWELCWVQLIVYRR